MPTDINLWPLRGVAVLIILLPVAVPAPAADFFPFTTPQANWSAR